MIRRLLSALASVWGSLTSFLVCHHDDGTLRDRDDAGIPVYRCRVCGDIREPVISRTDEERRLYQFSRPAHEGLRAKPKYPATVTQIRRAK